MQWDLSKKLSLNGKIAVVTGGGSGIGRACAMTIANAGARVFINDIHQKNGQRVVDEVRSMGPQAFFIYADLSKPQEIQHMVDEVLSRVQRIDILVNSVGLNIRAYAEDVTEEEWDQILNTNLKGVFFCCQKIGRVMITQRSGKIVNIGSLQGEEVLPMRAAYSGSKGGLKQISKAMAIEWAKYNINVNVVAPSFVRTPFVEKILEDKVWNDIMMRNTPLRRVCEPEEVADAVHFLVSNASNYITGHTLILDGGWTAGFSPE